MITEVRWGDVACVVVRDARAGAPTVSRALAIVHACMYDAWAAYDEKAVGTQLGGALRRPASERTKANKEKAISYAAYRALTDLFPADTETVYKPLMRKMGYDPEENSTDIETPAGIGNVACGAVLEYRHRDGANQLGEERSSGEWRVTSGEKEEDAGLKPGATKANVAVGERQRRVVEESVAGAQPGMAVPQGSNKKTNSEVGPYSGNYNGGRLTGAPYEDWTGYRTVNAPGTVPARATFTKPLNPDHWQPLMYTDANGSLVVQMFEGAQWGLVKPFALTSGDELRALAEPGPAKYGVGNEKPTEKEPEKPRGKDGGPDQIGAGVKPSLQEEAEKLVELSAGLTERQKAIAEYWTSVSGDDSGEGPSQKMAPTTAPEKARSGRPQEMAPTSGRRGESTAERWMRFAEFVCERDHATLDDEVKLFFILSNAMMDSDIAAWDAKRFYDSARPATVVPLLYRDKKIRAWGGPGKGTIEMDGGQWTPYQPGTLPTPASPEYVAETSAESAAAARVLALWTRSDRFGYSVTVAKGSSKIEPGAAPNAEIVLKWATFGEAADEAGMAGRYVGIQFARGDLAGRKLGRAVGDKVWEKAQKHFAETSAGASTSRQSAR